QREIYQIVLEAQKAAIDKVKPGARIGDLHNVAMSHMRSKGYEKYFIHGTSHHIGLEVHDVGDTSRPLEANMVITVEPGIYIPEEQLGVRTEDDVVVTATGHRVLSNFPKEISEIDGLFKKYRLVAGLYRIVDVEGTSQLAITCDDVQAVIERDAYRYFRLHRH